MRIFYLWVDVRKVWPSGGRGTHPRSITIKRISLLKIQQRFFAFCKSLLPCEAESQKRNFVHRANCRRCVHCVSDDQNAKSEINYDCPTLTVSTLVCVCTEHESK
ncbi:hypothetical protein T03_3934 [Trichinella britovi]|uniref:Uncharacterized protein n=1 Tax=Trichinella britovi TaxID=45882 RepID=A0A0V1AIZ4_TRIBR|nr:hypothetical protein T03_3934 [Trichinella britovi]